VHHSVVVIDQNILYTNKFVEVHHNAHDQAIESTWFDTTETMHGEDYKDILLKNTEFVRSLKLINYVASMHDFKFNIVPKLQDWVANQYAPELYKAGILRYAIVVSEEFISNLSIEQAVDEVNDKNREMFVIKYFKDIESARAWFER
jgi:hypothetical protein